MHGPSLPSDGFLGRLKSHKVIEWTLAYAALGYTLLHGVEMLSEAQGWPHVIVRVLSLGDRKNNRAVPLKPAQRGMANGLHSCQRLT